MDPEEKPKVLLVDDRPEGLVAMEAVLSSPAYAIVKAGSGAEALACLSENEFAVVLLDVQMPVMDGFETARIMRENHWSREVPIIFITAIDSESRYVYRGYETGAVDFLFKPLDAYVLKAKVEAFINLYRHKLKFRRQTEKLEREVSERKRIETELERARDAALETARLKSEFVANVSHEIRTPMNAIIGLTSLLLDTSLSQQQRQFAEMVRRSGDALLDIINNILDFSKIEAGKMGILSEPFDVRRLVEGTVEMFALRAEEKGIELSSRIEGDVPGALRGDAGRMRQVLMNLLGNAVKFTERGEIVLWVSGEPDAAGRVRLHVSVSDTGIGISSADQQGLFQAFNQVDASPTRRFGGTGLGLVISKQLVELMRGEIGVESRAGEGSRFWCRIPFELEKTESLPADAVRGTGLQGQKVLVADHFAARRETAIHYMSSWGMRPEGAASAGETLEKLRRAAEQGAPYAAALFNDQLPDQSGLSLARAVKDDPRLSSVRLAMLLPFSHTASQEEIQKAGIDACAPKPLQYGGLRDGLLAALGYESVRSPLLPRPALARTPGSFRVLLAEDNLVNQKVAALQLQKLGFEVDVVGNGRAAVEAAAGFPYDLILMDCQMPEMDGYTATVRIRELHNGQHIPIVAMTASVMEGDRERCLAAGMDDYLPKPVDLNQLSALLTKWNVTADPLNRAVVRKAEQISRT